MGCISRLVFAKMAMAIWCQGSGVRFVNRKESALTNGLALHPD